MDETRADDQHAAAFLAGMCAIVGLPNVGKSTLLNRLVGQRLSIVSHKAQTTRQRLLGIFSDESHQAVFVDTPGLLEPRYRLHDSMQSEAQLARIDADVLLYVVDAGWPRSVEHAADYRPPLGVPAVLCLNKIDRLAEGEGSLRERLLASSAWSADVSTIATTGIGVDRLREIILGLLPESPPLYPVDDVATAPVRHFAAEFVREACFEELSEELPYSIAVTVEEFRESEDPVYISAHIHVERESQKGIVIGRGGTMIRNLGRKARIKIERLLERPVYLDLRVKVSPNWRRRRGRLKLFGYNLPPETR
jgi:GTP-binding protein Era